MSKGFRHHITKISALILLSVYLLFSVGIIKATHFCMGREASVQYFTGEAKKCPCSIYASEKDSCCEDEHELIKIDDEQKVLSSRTTTQPVWKLERIFTERLLAQAIRVTHLTTEHQPDKSPPKVPLWKAHHSYVFYDDELINEAVA